SAHPVRGRVDGGVGREFVDRRPDVSVREESARTFTGVNRALGELLGPSGLCLLESADPSGDPQCPKRHHGHPDGKRAESGEHGGRGRGERTRRHEYEKGSHADRHGCHYGGQKDPFSPPWKSHSTPFTA